MSDEKKLLDMKMEFLKNEIFENQIYLEVSAFTIFFMIVGFLGTKYGAYHMQNRTITGYFMLIIAALLVISIIYMFINILYTINKKMEEVKKQKKALIRNWLEDDTGNSHYL